MGFKIRLLLTIFLFSFVCFFNSCTTLNFSSENPGLDQQDSGSFYQENGIWQHTQIRLILPSQAAESPVFYLQYEIQNNSGYGIEVIPQKDIDIEIYQNGSWVSPPSSDGFEIHPDVLHEPVKIPPYTASGSLQMRFGENLNVQYPHYKELGEGLYRIRLPYTFYQSPAALPQSNCELVAYFTVTPPWAEVE